MNADSPQSSSRWPSQIKFIVGNEACERFSYYGMRSILAGYITGELLKGGLGQTADKSTEIIHMFVSANYFLPLLGAWLSDKIIGRYHTILWVSLFYCAGHGVLACSDFAHDVSGKLWLLYAGLALIAFGSGGIKPCVSAFMGDQFRPDQNHLLQKAYGAFYWSINLGSFFSFLIIPWVKNHHGYSWAFGVPGIFMGIATLIFWMGTKHYVRIPVIRKPNWWWPIVALILILILAPAHIYFGKSAWLIRIEIAACAAFLVIAPMVLYNRVSSAKEKLEMGLFPVVWVTLIKFSQKPRIGFWDTARHYFTEKSVSNVIGVLRIMFIFALVPPFWSLFDQTNSTWVLQGLKMIPIKFGQIGLIQSLAPYWMSVSLITGVIAFSFLLWPIFRKHNPPFTNPVRFGLSAASLVISILITLFLLKLPTYEVGAEQMQSANPLLVMILVPVLTLLIYPRLGKWASPLRRMSYGMFLGAFSYVIVAGLQQRLEAGAQLSVAWQTVPYIVLTAAEVLVSTTGLEFAFREAAPEMKSLIMSFWLLTVTAGNLLVAFITNHFASASGEASVTSGRFMMYAGLSFVVAILFSLVAGFYRYRDEAAALGK